MPYRNHSLTEAARYADAQTEERGLPGALDDMGIDTEAVLHVAAQRALRLTLLTSRGEKALKAITQSNTPTPIRMSRAEDAMCSTLTIAVLDGLVIGWKANQIEARS